MIATCRAIDRVLLWQYYQIPLYAVDLRRTVHWDKVRHTGLRRQILAGIPRWLVVRRSQGSADRESVTARQSPAPALTKPVGDGLSRPAEPVDVSGAGDRAPFRAQKGRPYE